MVIVKVTSLHGIFKGTVCAHRRIHLPGHCAGVSYIDKDCRHGDIERIAVTVFVDD